MVNRCKLWRDNSLHHLRRTGCFLFLSILLTILSVVRSDCPNGTDSIAIQTNWLMQAQYAGLQVAKEMGFFDQECLNVAIKLGTYNETLLTCLGGPDDDPVASIRNGEAQIGVFLYSRVLVNRAQGLNLINVFQHFSRGGLIMVSKKVSSIQSFKQFKGKNVGYWSGNEYSLIATLNKYNIDPQKDVKLVLQSYSVIDLIEKPEKYDVVMAMSYDELAGLYMHKKTNTQLWEEEEFNVFHFESEHTDMCEDNIFMNKDWFDKNPSKHADILVRFLKATIKGLVLCRDDEDKCLRAMPDKGAQQQWAIREVNNIIWPAQSHGVGYINESIVWSTIDHVQKWGIIPTNYSVGNGSYDNTFVLEAHRRLRVEIESGNLSSDYSDVVGGQFSKPSLAFCLDSATDVVFICSNTTEDNYLLAILLPVCLTAGVVASFSGFVLFVWIVYLWNFKSSSTKFAPKDGGCTIIFTDIENSTRMWNEQPNDMKIGLRDHNSLMRNLLTKYSGYEVKTQGDSFMVAFKDPLNAVKWMLESQVELMKIHWRQNILQMEEAKEVRCNNGNIIYKVRMGGCICKPDIEKDISGRIDYFGNDVNQAARVSTFAHGGQIIVHQNLFAVIENRLDDLIVSGESQTPAIRNLGPFILNGIEGRHLLFEILPRSLSPRRDFFQQVRSEAKGSDLSVESDTGMEMLNRDTFPANKSAPAAEFNPEVNVYI